MEYNMVYIASDDIINSKAPDLCPLNFSKGFLMRH